MEHKEKTAASTYTWTSMCKDLERSCHVKYDSFLDANEDEIREEALVAGHRKSLSLSQEQFEAIANEPLTTAIINMVLTTTELEWMDEYERRWPYDCWSLNDNPFTQPTTSSGAFLQCVIRGCKFVGFSRNGLRRWATMRELLMFFGYPVRLAVQHNGSSSSFNVERNRKFSDMMCQVGNTLHVHMAGLALLYCLGLCTNKSTASPWLRSLKRKISEAT